MPPLVDLPLKDFIQAVAAKMPTPGGGAVAAAAAAQGAALAVMVARYSKGARCAGAAAELERHVSALTALVDEDAEAYRRVDAAIQLPKKSDEEKARRGESMEAAFAQAAEVPLRLMETALAALRQLPILGEEGSRRLASDLGGAVHMLSAGMQMAQLYVRVNAASLRDAALRERLTARSLDLMREAAVVIQSTLSAMGAPK